jgi:selenocysteine lyase/cysteine desulfurase
MAVVSFTIAGIAPSEIGLRLDEDYGVLCRVGLHCAPAAHRTLMTFPTGTVRFGLSVWNTAAEVERALDAVRLIAQDGKS